MKNRYLFVVLCFALILAGSFGFAQEDENLQTSIQPSVLNVYQLPSVRQTVAVAGGGYFPILNVYQDKMAAIFRTGAGHLGMDGALSVSWAALSGELWENQQIIIDGPVDDRNPAVGVLKNGRIVVAYHEQGSYGEDGKYDPALKKARCLVTHSDDGGATWSASKPLGIGGLERCSPYGRIVQTGDGTLLMNVYGAYAEGVPMPESWRRLKGDFAYLVQSQDNGETWGNPTTMMAQHNETAILDLGNKRLLAVGRSSSAMQRLDFSASVDMGKTWRSPLRLTNPMQHPGDLLRLSNGWILLLYGDRSQADKVIRGIVSRDSGRTWDLSYEIVCSRPVRGDFGYPSAALLPNGDVSVMYYWAGAAENAYDGTKANAFVVQFKESDLIEAYGALTASN